MLPWVLFSYASEADWWEGRSRYTVCFLAVGWHFFYMLTYARKRSGLICCCLLAFLHGAG